MNSIVLAIVVMLILSLSRLPVVLALIVASIAGGMHAGMPTKEIILAFNEGLGGGAPIAVAYATLGAFAVALSRSGVTQRLTSRVLDHIHYQGERSNTRLITWGLFISLILVGFASGTIVPVHIAFIPILVPPLLLIMNRLQLDRRAVACAITFSITVMYMTTPIGFGAIFLNDILMANINAAGRESGLEISRSMAPKAMLIPAAGMCLGLLVAVFVSYRKNREYRNLPIDGVREEMPAPLQRWQSALIVVALLLALAVQLWTGSMVFGGVAGFVILSLSGVVSWTEQDSVFTQGMRMMAMVGFIMIAASGFAGVMQATGEITELVKMSTELIGNNRSLAALIMLLVGLFITLGIGSSFSTVPIIAALYVPLGLSFGFSPLAITALVGTAGALGDAGSPVSDSTLGPTAGLNADRQHDHIWDTVVPTFVHFNIPLLIFGWFAVMTL